MAWQILTAKDFETSRWAGGITTQLAIGPAGAQYPNRDFLWRISSAQVELEHSVFTNLPDYHRFLTVLDGRPERSSCKLAAHPERSSPPGPSANLTEEPRWNPGDGARI